MKYAIIENNKVKQIQCDDIYKLSKTESIMEVENSVRAGMSYDGDKFFIPPHIPTEEELAQEKSKVEKKAIFDLVAGEGATKDEVIFKEINMLAEVVLGIAQTNPEAFQNDKVMEGANLFAQINEIRNK